MALFAEKITRIVETEMTLKKNPQLSKGMSKTLMDRKTETGCKQHCG